MAIYNLHRHDIVIKSNCFTFLQNIFGKTKLMNLHKAESLPFDQMLLKDKPKSFCLEAELGFNEAECLV